ncbi:hypothetical protein B0O99DRAFT_625411, partial [Bisporella sp. PMI_857]
MENQWRGNCTDIVKHRSNEQWQEQYEWLDTRYKYLHDLEIVILRYVKQRSAYR